MAVLILSLTGQTKPVSVCVAREYHRKIAPRVNQRIVVQMPPGSLGDDVEGIHALPAKL